MWGERTLKIEIILKLADYSWNFFPIVSQISVLFSLYSRGLEVRKLYIFYISLAATFYFLLIVFLRWQSQDPVASQQQMALAFEGNICIKSLQSPGILVRHRQE